jgi:hypothetical protein
MIAENCARVWLVPQKFWAATRNMKPEQADSLLQKISDLAEQNQMEALREYDFIIVGSLKDQRLQS